MELEDQIARKQENIEASIKQITVEKAKLENLDKYGQTEAPIEKTGPGEES